MRPAGPVANFRDDGHNICGGLLLVDVFPDEIAAELAAFLLMSRRHGALLFG